MSMSISYEDTGRTEQKARTRAALVAAARDLLSRGETPSVEDAASAASVSRATAYRYFPNQGALLVAAHPEVEAESLLGSDPPSDPVARLDRVVEGLGRIFLDAEESYRAMLRLSLEPDPADRGELALRKGRRFPWIREALEPVRDQLTGEAWERLVQAVASAVGIEALVALTDLGGLSPEQAVEVMRWSARAMLRSALEERGSGGRRDPLG